MIKDLDSPYTPGRRGKSWLKLKRELATLDVVVTAVEWGHGKRAHVLSDYTFAVRDGDRLLNVGKAYSGLTDAEIAEMTQWFQAHTLEDQGFRRVVEPTVVLEVAFNNVTRSDRHESGFALRFPRIVRLRPDKSVAEIDSLAAVGEIFERQDSLSKEGSKGRQNQGADPER
jgi:DNA ligase-1